VFYSRKKGMHGEVTPFNPMIKVGKDGGLIEVSLQWFKCLGQRMNGPRIGGKEMGGMKSKRIADTDKPFHFVTGGQVYLRPWNLGQANRFHSR